MTRIISPKLLKTISVKTRLSRWDRSAGETVVALKQQCSKCCLQLDWPPCKIMILVQALKLLLPSTSLPAKRVPFSPLWKKLGGGGRMGSFHENTMMILSSFSRPTPTLSHRDRMSQSAVGDKHVCRTLAFLPCAPQTSYTNFLPSLLSSSSLCARSPLPRWFLKRNLPRRVVFITRNERQIPNTCILSKSPSKKCFICR